MSIFTLGFISLINTFRKPATLKYPGENRTPTVRTRGAIVIKIEDCIYCGACDRRCPSDAITVDKPKKLWSIDRLRCISCSFCVEICPKKCLTTNSTYSGPYSAKEKTAVLEKFTGA